MLCKKSMTPMLKVPVGITLKHFEYSHNKTLKSHKHPTGNVKPATPDMAILHKLKKVKQIKCFHCKLFSGRVNLSICFTQRSKGAKFFSATYFFFLCSLRGTKQSTLTRIIPKSNRCLTNYPNFSYPF